MTPLCGVCAAWHQFSSISDFSISHLPPLENLNLEMPGIKLAAFHTETLLMIFSGMDLCTCQRLLVMNKTDKVHGRINFCLILKCESHYPQFRCSAHQLSCFELKGGYLFTGLRYIGSLFQMGSYFSIPATSSRWGHSNWPLLAQAKPGFS